MIEVRKAIKSDVEYINTLFHENSGRKADEKISDYIIKFPAIVAMDGLKLVGFCYSKPFAPDILELMNIFVKPEIRNKGFGKEIISEFEKYAFERFKSIILVNSVLYPSKEDKKLATNFYISCGYKEILSTKNSKVYGKNS